MDQLEELKHRAEQGDEAAKEELKKKEIEIGRQKLNIHKRA